MPMVEGILDRQKRGKRIYYLVTWEGYGSESNTWESRIDLIADGYQTMVRKYEQSRKILEEQALEEQNSPSETSRRSQSAMRESPKSAGTSLSTRRSPSRTRTSTPTRKQNSHRVRSPRRSSSVTRSMSSAEKQKQRGTGQSGSSQRSRGRLSASPNSDLRSQRQRKRSLSRELLEPSVDADELLREKMLIKALKVSNVFGGSGSSKSIKVETTITRTTRSDSIRRNLDDESSKSGDLFQRKVNDRKASKVQDIFGRNLLTRIKRSKRHDKEEDEPQNVIKKSTVLVTSIIVLALSGCLYNWLAPSMLRFEPVAREFYRDHLQFEIPPLVPLVSLIVFLRKKDDRPFTRWIAIALTWRCAMEFLLFLDSSLEYQYYALGSSAVATLALLLAIYTIVRDKESCSATLYTILLAICAFILSDSVLLATDDSIFPSRVVLQCLASMAVAYSPVLTAPPDQE